jgi:cobalt-zinc-cadmium efflux system outer membrane protein
MNGSIIVAACLALAQAAGSTGSIGSPGSTGAAHAYLDQAGGLSLEQAIATALEREPTLQAARAEVDVARGLRVQAALRPNPTMSVERRDEPGGTDSQTSLMVAWPLDLFRRTGRVQVADREIEAARHAAADRERLLAAAVRAQYGEVLTAIRDLSVIDEVIAVTRRQLDLTRARVAEGATPPLDRDLVDVEVRRLESDRLAQAGRIEEAMVELKRLLGMEAAGALAVADTLETIVGREHSILAGDRPDDTVALQRSDVREAESRVRLADAQIDRARRDGAIDVSLFGSYMRMDAGFMQLGIGRDGGFERVRGTFSYVAAGAMVNLPLRNRNQGGIAAAEAARAGATARHDAARLAAGVDLSAARIRDGWTRAAVAVYTGGARALARRNLDVITETYELGRATIFDVLAEQRRYLELESAFTRALRDAYDARTALLRARGDRP